MLNYLLLIVCAVIVLAVILYLFFWNRFISLFLTLLLRVALWNQGSSSTWVELGAIHVSLLAGRLSFKNLRYHSSNQTIKIVKGQVSWRYWIRSPAGEEDLYNSRIGGEDLGHTKSSWPPSCRIQISIQGLEWFLYNRTAAYDDIAEKLRSAGDHPMGTPRFSSENRRSRSRDTFRKSPVPPEATPLYPPSLYPTRSIGPPQMVRKAIAWFKSQLPRLDPTDLLPLGIEVNKAAVICGNASTPNLLILEFKEGGGTFGIVPSRSKFDIHKQLLNIKFKNVSSHYVDNTSFQSPMAEFGQKVDEKVKNSKYSSLRPYLSYHAFSKLWRRLKLSRLVKSERSNWIQAHGVGIRAWWRTNKGGEIISPVGPEALKLEYAAERHVLEAPELELLYYADVVGTVPPLEAQIRTGSADFEIGNGDLAPEWGAEIIVHGGFVRYGPWADRQRTELQRVFFPPSYHDMQPTAFLRPGDKRMWTTLKVFVELRGGTTLHIPFREASKNWMWDGLVDVPRPKTREAAHIHIKAGDGSTISYTVPMVISPGGYEGQLEVHLDDVGVTSTLNDIRLLKAESCRVRCEMPTPLAWNAERLWSFSISLRQPVFYLIRDHINMFTDLAKDWTSGPPGDYYRFVPMRYAAKVDFHKYEINTYVNDHNIIDKPLLKDENALMTFKGTSFRTKVDIDSSKFRPICTDVPFWIETPDVTVDLTLPRWHTHALHATPDRTNMGHIGYLRLEASYLYYGDVRPDNVDQLKLSFTTKNVVWKAFGWTVRHFMVFRDNYFGTFTHFSTLYEYLDKRKKGVQVGDPIELQYREGKSNMLQVQLQLGIDRGIIVAPAGLPGYERYDFDAPRGGTGGGLGSCVVLTIPTLQVQLRTHDYFMEMSLNIDLVTGSVREDWTEADSFVSVSHQHPNPMFCIDGLDIVAHRLFGPQPRTSTYVCIWEIHVGRVRALVTALEAKVLGAAGDALGLNFSDPLNAPAAEYAVPSDPDVTFLKVSVDAVTAVWLAGDCALEVRVPRGLQINHNDLAGTLHRKATAIRFPEVTLKAFKSFGSVDRCWLAATTLTFDINMDMYSRPDGWRESARAQAEFVSKQDALTGRAKVLYARGPEALVADLRRSRGSSKAGLYLPYPQVPAADNPRRRRRLGTRVKDREAIPPLSRHFSTSDGPISESESEEVISEAIRDARLAKSRPATPMTFRNFEDDGSIASGDESDDADLTEYADDSESDVYELRDEGFSDHTKVADRYDAQLISSLWHWDDSPFLLVRDRWSSVAGHRDNAPPIGAAEKSPVDCFMLREELSFGRDTTVFRITSQHGVDIRLTPLVASCVGALFSEVTLSRLSPELYIDSVISRYVRSISDTRLKGQHTVVDLCIPSARLRFMHTVPSANVSASSSRKDRGITLLDMKFQQLSLMGSIVAKFQELPFKQNLVCTIQGLSAALGVVEPRQVRSHETAHQFFPLCDIRLSSTTFRWTEVQVSISAQSSSITVEHASPSVVGASALVIVPCIQSLQRDLSRIGQQSEGVSRRLVRQILHVAEKKAMVDPLSTIQPSFLVQAGCPQQIRTSPTFKALLHLRRSLRELDTMERITFTHGHLDQQSDVRPSEWLPLLQRQVSAYAADPDSSGQTEGLRLEDLLSAASPRSSDVDGPAFSVVSLDLELGEVKTYLFNESRTSSNTFTLGAIVTSVSLRPSVISAAHASRSTKSLVAASLEHRRQDVKHLGIAFTVGNAEAYLLPHILDLAQQTIRVWRHYQAGQEHRSKRCPHPVSSEISPITPPAFVVDLTMVVDRCRIQAAAETLTFDAGASGIILISNNFIPSSRIQDTHGNSALSGNQSVIFKDIFFRARETRKASASDSLASLTFKQGRINGVIRQELDSGLTVRGVVAVEALQLSIPRSALRLYRFVEEWKADYLSGIETTMQSLLAELQGASKQALSSPSRSPAQKPAIQAHLCLGTLAIVLQMMPGTWLSWEIADVFAFAKSKSTPQTLSYSFGLQLKSQLLSISSKTNTGDSAAGTRVKFRLPVASVAGEYDGSAIQVMASIAFFDANLRPSHWDALMFIQQKFGQDFDDLVLLVQETRSKAKRPSSSSAGAHVKPVPRLKFDSLLRMKGFRFGLQGVSSTLYLECEDIYGALHNDVGDAWSLELSDLSLSFAPRGSTSMGYSASYRNSRSAFVSIDVKGAYKTLAEARSLQVSVSKIHAVMQPSSIGEVGDFVDHLQAELASKKEERALEMSKFREKTRSIMKSLEIRVSEKTSDDSSSWLDKSNLELSIKNIGVAFPLTLEQELQPPLFRRDTKAVRAFLFSVKSITFDAHRGASGSAAMKRFSFQFVERFRQAVPGDFGGENHKTQNRIVYPDVNARVRSDRRGNMRQLRVAANVSGFVLDLDSGISDYIFSLIDVYRHGKERVDRITGVGSRPAVSADMMPRLSTRPDQTHYSALPTSNILASLNFLSGQVRIHGNSGTRARKTRSVFPAIREITDESVLDSAEILDLPGLSVWAEYRATPASRKLSGSRSAEPSILMFKSTIHSSQNTLRPTLLPFVTEVIKHVEERLRKVSTSGPDTPKSSRSELSASQALESRIDEELRAVSSLNISLSLRIDQSKLELTCQPDVNVIAGLHWDSGGFIVSISPGARRVTFTGSVGGLTAGLKHGFLSDDCVRVDARNLGFSVTFGKTDNGEGKPVNSMSLVLDTEFSGAVHFSRLQDVLCFKAVWLDRIPVFGNPNFATPSTPAKGLVALPNPGTVEQGFVTALLIRIRRTTLEMDLGQSISAITMDLSNVVFRTRLTEALSEVALCIMKVDMRFAGNLSGQAAVPDFSFHTMRRREDAVAHEAESNRLLELSMSTGAFNITLESERQQLLYYHAEPLHVMIFDDWSHASSEHHWLQLSFVVSGSEVVAVVTVGTIPRLIMYANKFKANLDAQREGASRESKAFRVASTPKPDNPLSAVASAMIQSARTRLTEPESRVSYVIRQHMSLHLDLLRLTVFPRTVRDVEMAQLVGRDVQARLDRHVDPDGLTAHRDLHLEFAGISVARFHQLNTSLAMKTTSDNAKYWLDALTKDASEAIIFGLPSMKMSMDSTEAVEDRIRVLAYNFHSHFLRETDMKREDIYITLNMSLYAWLTILRKNFAREMEQVQASGDGHSTKLQATSASSLRRKAGEQSFSLDTLDAPLYKPPPGPADSSQPGRPPNVRASTFTHSRSVSHAGSFPASHNPALPSQDPIARDSANDPSKIPTVPASLASTQDKGLIFRPQNRQIERLTMRQLGEATPDVMHPFFMKKSGFNLEDSLPQYVHEYATTPLEEIMRALLQLYSKQLRVKSDLSSKT